MIIFNTLFECKCNISSCSGTACTIPLKNEKNYVENIINLIKIVFFLCSMTDDDFIG